MNAPKHALRAITCPHCGGTLEVRAAGWSVNLACRYCGSILDVSRPEVQLIQKHNRAAAGFALPLGNRGRLFDTEWEAIGALERSDAWSNWREYLLFNPYVGYRWLVEYEGDWTFGTMLLDRPEEKGEVVVWQGQPFRQEDEAALATTCAVIGEFYWRVSSGDRALCTSYSCRDVTLSREEADGEVNWTRLVALSGGEVERAFGILPPEPEKPRGGGNKGRGYALFEAEAAPGKTDIRAMLGLSLLTLVAALILMFGFAGSSAQVRADIEAPFGRTAEGIRLGSITVNRPWQFVSVTSRADTLDNQWVDLDYSLVDRATGQSLDASDIVEHYTGRDSDGSWSEGSTRATIQFGHIPKGTYDVFVDAGAHRWPTDVPPDTPASSWSTPTYGIWGEQKPGPVPVAITVKTNTMPQGNFWTLCILVMLLPARAIYRGWKNR